MLGAMKGVHNKEEELLGTKDAKITISPFHHLPLAEADHGGRGAPGQHGGPDPQPVQHAAGHARALPTVRVLSNCSPYHRANATHLLFCGSTD